MKEQQCSNSGVVEATAVVSRGFGVQMLVMTIRLDTTGMCSMTATLVLYCGIWRPISVLHVACQILSLNNTTYRSLVQVVHASYVGVDCTQPPRARVTTWQKRPIMHGRSSDVDYNLTFTIGPLKARKIRIQQVLRDLHGGIGIPALRPPLADAAPEDLSGRVEED